MMIAFLVSGKDLKDVDKNYHPNWSYAHSGLMD